MTENDLEEEDDESNDDEEDMSLRFEKLDKVDPLREEEDEMLFRQS